MATYFRATQLFLVANACLAKGRCRMTRRFHRCRSGRNTARDIGELDTNELLYRAIRFTDRIAVITGPSEIRIRERNPPMRLIS